MRAAPWSLDEFATDVYFGGAPDPAPAEREAQALSADAVAAAYERRLVSERARIEAEAYARGRADGERAAQATLDETLTHALQALGSATQSVQLHESRWLSNAEENIAAMAIIVAQHVLQREIFADPSFVTDLVASVVAQYPVDQEVSIRLHPEDLSACRAVLQQDGGPVRLLRWIADASIQRGGCLVEGRERIIDGRVDTALERAYRALAGVQA
jgi:flagellar biosynthesis/type III secretory pathway protein FliH